MQFVKLQYLTFCFGQVWWAGSRKLQAKDCGGEVDVLVNFNSGGEIDEKTWAFTFGKCLRDEFYFYDVAERKLSEHFSVYVIQQEIVVAPMFADFFPLSWYH